MDIFKKYARLSLLDAPSTYEAHTLHARTFRRAEKDLNTPEASNQAN